MMGTLSCSSGPVCNLADVTNGTPCGTGDACCNGSCVDTTSNPSGCGSACRVCPSGAGCVNSGCALEFGDFTPFSPCGTNVNRTIASGLLLGQMVTLPTMTVTGLGVVGNPGGAATMMALYADGSGAPFLLEATSTEEVIGSGVNVLPVAPSKMIQAGKYWIMAEFNTAATICVDNSTSGSFVFGTEPFGTFPANFSGVPATTVSNTIDYNFFVISSD
jgi:hypothetical protein